MNGKKLAKDLIIGITSLAFALVCHKVGGQNNTPPWGNLMVVAIIVSGIFLLSALGQCAFYAGRRLARGLLTTKPRRIVTGAVTIVVWFFTVTIVFIPAISWYEGLVSWPTIFWASMIVAVSGFSGGIIITALYPRYPSNLNPTPKVG